MTAPSLSATPTPPEYLTTTQLCARLGICRRTVENHGLQQYALRVGAQWRFDWDQVLAHYARRTKAAQRPV